MDFRVRLHINDVLNMVFPLRFSSTDDNVVKTIPVYMDPQKLLHCVSNYYASDISVGFQYNKHSDFTFSKKVFVCFIFHIFLDNWYQSQTGLLRS